MEIGLDNLFNRNEIRRLEKAARDKNKNKLIDWMDSFGSQISSFYYSLYNDKFSKELANSLDTIILTIIYTLYTSKYIRVKPNDLDIILDELYKNIDSFRTGRYKLEDYEQILKKSGIDLQGCIYKQRLQSIISVIYEDKYKEDAQKFIDKYKTSNICIILYNTSKPTEDEIKLNIEKINMCDELHIFGNNEYFNKYRTYAEQYNIPVINVPEIKEVEDSE